MAAVCSWLVTCAWVAWPRCQGYYKGFGSLNKINPGYGRTKLFVTWPLDLLSRSVAKLYNNMISKLLCQLYSEARFIPSIGILEPTMWKMWSPNSLAKDDHGDSNPYTLLLRPQPECYNPTMQLQEDNEIRFLKFCKNLRPIRVERPSSIFRVKRLLRTAELFKNSVLAGYVIFSACCVQMQPVKMLMYNAHMCVCACVCVRAGVCVWVCVCERG